jgi:hypothetical protein
MNNITIIEHPELVRAVSARELHAFSDVNAHCITCSCFKHLLYNSYIINNHPLKRYFQLLENFKLPEDLIYTGKNKSMYRKLKLNDFTLKDFIYFMYLSNRVFIVYHMYDGVQPCSMAAELGNRGYNYVKHDFDILIRSIIFYIGKQLRRFESWIDICNCAYCKKLLKKYEKHSPIFNDSDDKYVNELLNMKLGDFIQLIKNIDLPLGIMTYEDKLIHNYICIANNQEKWEYVRNLVDEFIKRKIND